MSPSLNELQKRMHSQKLKKWLVVLILSMSCICWRSVCDGDPADCSNDKFDCGSIAYLSYPFWGGTRSQECGREGFQLSCDANVPTINISSLSYRLQQLDFATNSLTVSRQDLFDSSCTKLLRNTTMDTVLFQFPPNSTDRNLSLYYGCTGAPANPLNGLRCGTTETGRVVNLFSVDNDGPGAGIRCNSSIYVPINSKDAETLKNPSYSSINILNSALKAGFSIRWLNDTKQLASPYCNSEAYAGSCAPNARKDSVNRRLMQRSAGNVSETGYSSRVCCYATSAANTKPPVSTTPTKSSMAPATSPAPQPGYGLPPVPSRPSSGYHPNNSRNQHGKKRGKEIVIIVVAITTAAAIIIVSISMHYLLKRRQSGSGLINPPTSKHDVENFLLQHGSLAPKRYKYCELKKITRSFGEKLGEGGYGRVYKGKLGDGRPVAVKVLAKVDSSSSGEDFMNEVASISRTSHVNVVTLLGFCSQGRKRALVYEFMPNSSLDKFLSHNKSAVVTMDLEKLFKIAVGIAKGLEYLHTGCSPKIVHFDIKPQNILLDEDLCPKIADFGLAKLCKKKQSIVSSMPPGPRGTAGYIAPEVYSRNFGGVSHKSDVYSYGMLLLNMAQQKKAVECDQAEAEVVQSSEDYFPDNIYDEVIRDVGLEDEEKETITKMRVVGLWCIQTSPSNRPSISKVVEMLEGSLNSIQIPPKPILCEPILCEPILCEPLPESSSTQTSSDHD